MNQTTDYHIHGDNIVECERAFDLIKASLANEIISISGPNGTPVCPKFQLNVRYTDKPISLTFYPGFGRWNEDMLQLVRERGGILREAADVIISGVSAGVEEPLIAIEYCGALPAGNQAWQRSGRAYSFGQARIPYLYVAELGGYELDANRSRKAPRMPNPAVPFSYLTYSFEQSVPVLPIFITSPGADEASRSAHADEFADEELIALTRAIFLHEDASAIRETLRGKILALVKKRAEAARAGKTLTAEQWEGAYSALKEGQSLVEYLVQNTALTWSKTAYIEGLTKTAKSLMQLAQVFAIGLTSSDLPMCVVPRSKRQAFASKLVKLYKKLPAEFVTWLERNEHLAICWVMGFKPRGDDARPDRGLPPLARMLIGHGSDLLTVVYGPAPAATWPMLRDAPAALAERNGLWEAIMAVSDALLIDTATDKLTRHGFLRPHWEQSLVRPVARTILVQPAPTRVGENDVDTVLHTLFAHYSGNEVFEGMCNPPGGDWSGVSLQPPDRSLELRWLSLPRVSGDDTKRPDHVFQFFGVSPRSVILSVESKEQAGSVEANIGPRLSEYISRLITREASVQRRDSSSAWGHSTHILNIKDFIFASAVAFISNSESQIKSVIKIARVDLLLAYTFQTKGEACEIRFIPMTEVGKAISEYVSRLKLSDTGITVRVG
jgi:hypothetical protein